MIKIIARINKKVKKISFFSLFSLKIAQKYLKLHQQQTIISVILAILLLRVFSMKKNKKTAWPTRSKLVQKLDQVFSVYIRLSVADKDWMITCPLCGARVHRTKAQNMHFIKRSVYKYRRDEKNCHAGCVKCNVILHGNYIVYTRRMQRKYWEILVDEMINDRQIMKIATSSLQEMIAHYQSMVDELRRTKGL